MNVLAWVVIVPVLAIALVDAPVRLADRPGHPLDRLDGGVVALGHPPRSQERAVAGPRVGLNAVEGTIQRVDSVVRRPAQTRSQGVATTAPAGADRSGAPVRTPRLNTAVELRGQVRDGRAGGPAPMGRTRPNVDGSPAPGKAPESGGAPPQTDQPAPEGSATPQDGGQRSPGPPPTLARPARPAPDPEADPPKSPPDETPPPGTTTPPPTSPSGDKPPPPAAEPPAQDDPPGPLSTPPQGGKPPH